MKNYKEYTQEEVHAILYRFIRNYERFIKDKTSNIKLKAVLPNCDSQFYKLFGKNNYTWLKKGERPDTVKTNHIRSVYKLCPEIFTHDDCT